MMALIALGVWIYLCFAHGRFWSSSPQLPAASPAQCPAVDIIVPARNEAQTIGAAIASLAAQDYPGRFRIILVDDDSQDSTAAEAKAHADAGAELSVLRLNSKPAGWSGKSWALSQGVAASSAPLLLFTDADIVHDPRHLSSLVAHLTQSGVNMLSEMVRLNCSSLAERALVPAFVYFFQMLYPFARVNDANSGVAAAAGGTVLIRRDTLRSIGGIEAIKHTLIDDVALARAAKTVGGIFLGHSGLAVSIRAYPAFADIWQMISRTAFTQLRHSAGLLILTLMGLTLVWLVPPYEAAFGSGAYRTCGVVTCALAAASFLPTLQRYTRSPAWVLALPLIASFYMLATVSSALDYWRGRGARWKNRSYGN